MADLVEILRGTSLLSSVPTADLEALAAGSRVRTFRRGQVVFTTGDPGDTVLVVLSGRVKVVVRSADGAELTLTIIGPGGMFGELGVGGRQFRRLVLGIPLFFGGTVRLNQSERGADDTAD